VWDSPSPKFIMGGSKEEKYDHPTQKPIVLMEKSILNHAKIGELVYEPFGRSGTTLAAAEKTGRVCYASENRTAPSSALFRHTSRTPRRESRRGLPKEEKRSCPWKCQPARETWYVDAVKASEDTR